MNVQLFGAVSLYYANFSCCQVHSQPGKDSGAWGKVYGDEDHTQLSNETMHIYLAADTRAHDITRIIKLWD